MLTGSSANERISRFQKSDGYLLGALILGALSFLTLLAYHQVADGDLWAKLGIGAELREHGLFPRHDFFAFTPTLPKWVDHEWGAGLVFFTVLQWFGPIGLMVIKIVLALGCISLLLVVERRMGTGWAAILFLAAPSAFCVLGGYVPVVRSQAFTYFFFAATLLCLEEIRRGRLWLAALLPIATLLWANLHGGFVAGLGVMIIYSGWAVLQQKKTARWVLPGATASCFAVTLINPYGLDFWRYLVPALLHPRSRISEWQPMQFFTFAVDHFVVFRILVLLAIVVVALGWRNVTRERRSFEGLSVILVTLYLAMHSRRHEPFFGAACLAYLGPYVEATAQRLKKNRLGMMMTAPRVAGILFAGYAGLAAWVSIRILPQVSFQVLAPVGFYPVRELDILSRAAAAGNVAVPFRWGSYVSWRAYPRIKISVDGRYEAAYPESTFQMNQAFYDKHGTNWDRLVRDFAVDYVIVDIGNTGLAPEDLSKLGYVLIWQSGQSSALFARQPVADPLLRVAKELSQEEPPRTIEPLDPAIPKAWPPP